LGIALKAIYYTAYGSYDVLQIKEVEKPVPKEDEVLIKVHAASINSWDWGLVTGTPKIFRLFARRPKHNILGCDVAGTIESVGSKVTKLKPGAQVYGDLCENSFGSIAEYTCARENALEIKPTEMSFEEAAAIPQAGLLALQSFLYKMKIKPGQTILINGAGGGVGSFGIQIAKLYGAEVTGVDHPKKFAMMRSIGCDHVIDYTKVNFVKEGIKYDYILDVNTDRSIFSYLRALKPRGTYVTVGGHLGKLLLIFLLRPIVALFTGKHLRLLPLKPNKNLDKLSTLYKEGKLKCIIDGPYKLEQGVDAFKAFSDSDFKGKIVITI